MENHDLKSLKRLYEDGFKCIRYELDEEESLTVYLKHFEREKTQELLVKDKKAVENIKSFIDLN